MKGSSVGDSTKSERESGKGLLWLVLWSKDLFLRPMVVFPQGKGTERTGRTEEASAKPEAPRAY